MKRRQWLPGVALLGTVVLLLGGCGGGGGGDGGGRSQPQSITADNRVSVTDNAVGAVSTMSDVAAFGQEILGALQDPSAPLRVAARSAAAVAIPNACDSGSAELTFNDSAPLAQLSPGDVATVTFSSCVKADDQDPTHQETFNGAVSFGIAAIATPPTPFFQPPFDMTFAFGFSNFSVADNGSTTAVSGGFDFRVATDGATGSVTLSGASFSLSESGSSVALANFSFTGTSDSDGNYTAEAWGRLTSSDFSGNYIDFETTTAFSGTEPDNPDTGVLVVSGAAGSTITVEVQDSSTLSVALDANGDGTTDPGYPVFVPWPEN